MDEIDAPLHIWTTLSRSSWFVDVHLNRVYSLTTVHSAAVNIAGSMSHTPISAFFRDKLRSGRVRSQGLSGLIF